MNKIHPLIPRRLTHEIVPAVLPPAATDTAPHNDTTPPTPVPSQGSTESTSPSSSSNSPFSINSQFSPSMVIILVVLLSTFFFMGFFAIYVRRCANDENQNSRQSGRGNGANIPRRQDVLLRGLGLDPAVVDNFPMVSYAAAKRKGCCECVVCLAEFDRGEQLKQLPKCKHVFHPECIGLWLQSHTTCPLCRRNLANSERWSVSWRWGGSSRGGQLPESVRASRPLADNGGEGEPQSVRGDWYAGSPVGEDGRRAGRGSPPAGPIAAWTSEIVPEDDEEQQQGMSLSCELQEAVAGAAQGRPRLGRSNSTGHSLQKEGMSRAGLLMGCMPRGRSQRLQRSRSARVRVVDDDRVRRQLQNP